MSITDEVLHQTVDTFVIESVGEVKVSTVYIGGFCDYWEVAVVWPETWEGVQYTPDGICTEVVGCHRSFVDGREDAKETHAWWADEEKLARLALSHMRLKMTPEEWHGRRRLS